MVYISRIVPGPSVVPKLFTLKEEEGTLWKCEESGDGEVLMEGTLVYPRNRVPREGEKKGAPEK